MLRKIRTALAIALAICFVLSAAALAADNGYDGVVTIVHTNDVHSNVAVEPYVKGYVDSLRAAGRDVVLVSAGDAFKGTAFATMTDGLDVAAVMNMAGYQLFTVGNHEQMLGIERFKKIVDKAEFPVLAANIGGVWRDAIPEIKDYVIMEFGGTKIAFIGITYPDLSDDDAPATIISAAERAKAAAQAEGAGIFIAITHLGIKDTNENIRSTYLAEKCPWLTAVIDGHCHTAHESGIRQGGVLIAETGEYGNNIGVVELTIKSGEVTNAAAKLIPIKGHEEDSGIAPDAQIQAFIDEVNAKSAEYLAEVVAVTPVDLDGVREFSRTRETNFGNLVTDAMREAAGTDIALVLGPYLRVDIPAGDITRDQLMTALYENVDLCVVKAKGREIYEIMARGVSMYPGENTWFTHISGAKVEFNPDLGNCLINIRMPDGSPFDMDAEYTVALRSENVPTYFPDREFTTGCGTICEVVADYLNSGGTVTREAAGRIKPVDTVFPDILGHWAKYAVVGMLRLKGMTGYHDGTFRPNAPIVLNDFIKLLTTVFDLTDEDVEAVFPGGGNDKPLARKDAAVCFMRLIGRLEITLTPADAEAFTDLGGVSGEAASAIEALRSAKLVNGVGGGLFAPESNATRGEMAALASRILDIAMIGENAA